MATFLLDTTTLTLLDRQHPRVVAALQSHVNDVIAITAINVEEMLSGWYQRLRSARSNFQRASAYRTLSRATTFLARFPIIAPSEAALDEADRLLRLRLNVGRMDLTIAAIALEVGAVVVTNNVRDFSRVPGLAFVDWSV